ncbi:MAG: acetoacetate--CoA ligase [Burkholderiales bacterium]|jgi:acetoacetyl-CoA synthetase
MAAEPIWRPSAERIERAGMTRYLRWLKANRGLQFADYESLWRWSVDHIEDFWKSIWEFGGVRAHSGYRRVLDKHVMPGARWFEGATLNYAEHALACAAQPARRDKPALVFQSELQSRTVLTWEQLAQQVGALTATLGRLGIEPQDRVASYMPNIPQSVIALLASASRGAVWSSCSPDMGPASVLDRFRQIEPRVLFAVDGYRYGGKDFDRRDVVRELVAQLPSVGVVVFVPYLDDDATLDLQTGEQRRVSSIRFDDAIAEHAAPEFLPVAFDHPLWIVYSSGTTGMPKPIVHGHGGTVVENIKGQTLHLDLDENDRFFWFSSTSWIMWNLLVSSLLSGCTMIQFDGNPGYPDAGTLWKLAQDEGITFFGTSPAFIGLCRKNGIEPAAQFDLSSIRTLGCTGSPLTADAYEWVYQHVSPDLLLASISGGTDPGTAFLGCCPTLPVYAGEMQCRGLGVATYAFDDDGKPVYDEVGELVCVEPIPSMPLYFWGDEDGSRYFESYFDTWPNVWKHGDWLKLVRRAESVTGIIYGRSDSTINRYGIRMGTSEIYRIVEALPEVLDSLTIDLEYLGKKSFMVLFVVLREQAQQVSPGLAQRIEATIRTQLSARYVPDEIVAIPDVPRTISGKKMEVPVKKILLGMPAAGAVNRDSMANPLSIDWFVRYAEQRNAAG